MIAVNGSEVLQRTCTVRISGGLGNQLFQYAAGRALALSNDTALELDVSFFRRRRKRGFELSRFPIHAKLAAEKGWLRRFRQRIAGDRGVYREPHFHFDREFSNLQSPCILDGYFQSERYFESHASLIRTELTCPVSTDPNTCAIAKLITEQRATSLHVRRGDYVSHPKAAQIYHVCTLDYYRNAMEMIPGDDPVFVFSDDIQWAKENLPRVKPLVFPEGASMRSALDDLWLMTQAENHIIANSTFSWWGAWMAKSTSGVKIAPRQWFIDEAIDDRDLIPKSWIRL